VSVTTRAIGSAIDRVDGPEKVTGRARYAFEHAVEGAAYAVLVQSTVAKGRVRAIDTSGALAHPGVLAVLSHENAPRLPKAEGELAVFQSRDVAYRGQIVAAVVAETLEAAQEGAALVRLDLESVRHDVELRRDHPRLYKPEEVNPAFDTDTSQGDFDAAFAAAAITVDETYETPWEHNNPMEPHASIAIWSAGNLTIYDASQGVFPARGTIAKALGLEPTQVRVLAPHVGGGFGSKGTPRPQVIVAALAAQLVDRPVKLAVTRQQMFDLTGYRTPTIQRVRLGADDRGHLVAIAHDAFEQTSTIDEFAEQTTVVTRMLYASENRQTTHRLVALDVPTPSWMRAPGECPGMFALESAMDELAERSGIDPVELRIRNEPSVDPETGKPFSTRNLVACLRDGADRFGWWNRSPRSEGAWQIGMGVAASTYPARRSPSTAHVSREGTNFLVRIAAADIGTGARTALTQIAADALGVAPERVRMEIADSDFGQAMLAGGSMGTSSWGTAVMLACRQLVDSDGDEARADTSELDEPNATSNHAFGAQFVEARVNQQTGEIRVTRALGVFACGTIINPKTARSQFIGGMTMGIGMALLEAGIVDPRFGDVVNHDLAMYHVPVYADIPDIEVAWLDEHDPCVNPMGAKGIGEIGIVGTAAAVANAVHHATGRRFRRLPIHLADVLS